MKKARALTAADAGYGDIKVEPRTRTWTNDALTSSLWMPVG